MKKRIISCLLSFFVCTSIPSYIVYADENTTQNNDKSIINSEELVDRNEETVLNEAMPLQTISNEKDLPSNVDNSQTKYFPAIYNQIGGTCAAYSIVYYQATYTINKAKDIPSDCDDNILSPIFAFNSANGEDSEGSNPGIVISALEDIGCPTISKVPIDNESFPQYYTSWYPTKDIWTSAQEHRITDSTCMLFDYTYDSINYIKKILSNGTLISFGTDIYKWNYKELPDSTLNGNRIGEQIIPYCNSEFGGGEHGMTIVGYDDNLWFDINHNNAVDEGEQGAFKIVNSWGSDWGNDGFIWLSYDALFKQSMVNGVEFDNNRVGAFQGNLDNLYILSYENTTPTAYLEFTMNTSKRDQIDVTVEEIDGKNTYEYPLTFSTATNKGGELSFDGTTKSNDGTFVFDISRINSNLKPEDLKNKEFKIHFKDKKLDGTSLTIKDVKLIDVQNNITYDILDKPLSIDGDRISISSIKANVTTPTNIKSTILNNNISLTWDECTSSSSRIYKYQIFRNNILIGESNTNSFIDENPNNGTTTYYIKAIDYNNNSSLKGECTINNTQTTIYYKSKYDEANIHYCIGDGKWTKVPGIPMEISDTMKGYFEYTINLNEYDEDTKIKLCFNNDNNKWDNNNRKNYTLSKGTYIIEDGKITKINDDMKINKIMITSNPSGTANVFTDISNLHSIGQVFYQLTYLNDDISYSTSICGDATTLSECNLKYEGEYKVEACVLVNDESITFTDIVNYKANKEFDITSYNSDITSPTTLGNTIKFTTETNDNDALYRFAILKDGKNVFARKYNSNNSTAWTPTEAGTYTVYFKAKNKEGIEKTKTLSFTVKENDYIIIDNVTTNLNSKFSLGKSITLKTFASCNYSLKYRFVVIKNNKNVYTRGYNSKNYASWTPKEPGKYTIYYFAKDDFGHIVSKTKDITIK